MTTDSGLASGRGPSSTRLISFIGVETETAPFGFAFLGPGSSGAIDAGSMMTPVRARTPAQAPADRLGAGMIAGAGMGAAMASVGVGGAGGAEAAYSRLRSEALVMRAPDKAVERSRRRTGARGR